MTLFKLTQARAALRQASTYQEWSLAAMAHDEASGQARWKANEPSRIYDYASIRSRLDELRSFRRSGDDHALLFALNEDVHGNTGRIGRAELYERAKFGTKQLVTDYIDEVAASLRHLADAPLKGVNAQQRLDFFRRASLCFGRSALLLSGGGVYGNFHAGVIKAMVEQDVLPGILSGASAGSVMAAIVGTHVRSELADALSARNLQIETRTNEKVVAEKAGLLFPRFDFEDVRRHVERLIPDLTFAEALERTGVRINISISPAALHQTPRLMNAIASPEVYVRSAVLASCAVPGIYPPVSLSAKNRYGKPQPYLAGRRWVDGSVADDIPAKRLSRLYAVNHFIVSQVNPFALLQRPVQGPSTMGQGLSQFWHHTAKNAVRSWHNVADRYGRRWPDLAYAMNSGVSLWTQDYGGDINILPPMGMVRPLRGMTRPQESELEAIIRAGERATWPRIEMIRNCTKVGRVLDAILERLDAPDRRGPKRVASRESGPERRPSGGESKVIEGARTSRKQVSK